MFPIHRDNDSRTKNGEQTPREWRWVDGYIDGHYEEQRGPHPLVNAADVNRMNTHQIGLKIGFPVNTYMEIS